MVGMKERTHPSYDSRVRSWDFFLLSYKGGDPYCFGNMLFGHRYEDPDDYETRQKRSYYLNFTRPVVDIYTKYICGQPLLRTAEGSGKSRFEKFQEDCDGRGTKLATFIRVISSLSSIFGRCGVLVLGVDPKKIPLVATAVVDQTAMPRLRLVRPQTLIDWSRDEYGNLLWIMLRYNILDDSDPRVERKVLTRYELWTTTTWSLYGKTENSDVLTVLSQGEHGLGKVPYVEFFNADVDADYEPESLIEDIAIINRTIFNYSSLLDEILYLQAFSQLTIPADSGEINQKIISTKRAFTYPKDAPYPPAYIAPDASQARLFIDLNTNLVSEIFRLATLRKSGNQSTDQYATAFGKMVDFEDTEAALTSKANLMETSERQLSVEVGGVMGIKGELWTPNYPKTFEVRSFTQEIADALSLESLQMGQTFMTRTKQKIARRALPQEDSDTFEKINSEIEKLSAPLPELDPHMGDTTKFTRKVSSPSAENPPNSETVK
jgi:hypothetical protein